MTICYFKGINLTKNFVLSKIKKWIRKMDDEHLSMLCDFINEMDIEITRNENTVTFMVGSEITTISTEEQNTKTEGQSDFFYGP
jgi:hypothetical protein